MPYFLYIALFLAHWAPYYIFLAIGDKNTSLFLRFSSMPNMAFCHLQKKSQETVGVEHIMSKIYVHIYCLYRKINRVASFVWPNYILLELLEHSDQAEQSFRSWIDLSIYDGIRLRLVCLLARIFIHTDFIYLCRNGIVVECNNMGGKFICVLKFIFCVYQMKSISPWVLWCQILTTKQFSKNSEIPRCSKFEIKIKIVYIMSKYSRGFFREQKIICARKLFLCRLYLEIFLKEL